MASLTAIQLELIRSNLTNADGSITFKSSLSKARRQNLERLKLEHGVKSNFATISCYLLWHGLTDLPLCACGSGERVTFPKLASCSVKCARQMVLAREYTFTRTTSTQW